MLSDAVTPQHVCEVISRATGIPLENLVAGEREKLLKLEQDLHKQVVGQDKAVAAVSDCVRQSRAGLLPHDRPMGVFLFCGPSGVGKTQLSKALAKQLFDSEAAMVRVDTCTAFVLVAAFQTVATSDQIFLYAGSARSALTCPSTWRNIPFRA